MREARVPASIIPSHRQGGEGGLGPEWELAGNQRYWQGGL